MAQESTQESTMASRSTEPSRATQQACGYLTQQSSFELINLPRPAPPTREVSKPDARVGYSGSITTTAKTDERACGYSYLRAAFLLNDPVQPLRVPRSQGSACQETARFLRRVLELTNHPVSAMPLPHVFL
jgi:hypothetical protein